MENSKQPHDYKAQKATFLPPLKEKSGDSTWAGIPWGNSNLTAQKD